MASQITRELDAAATALAEQEEAAAKELEAARAAEADWWATYLERKAEVEAAKAAEAEEERKKERARWGLYD